MAAALVSTPARAQSRAGENAVTQAEDAFGYSVGRESLGIYDADNHLFFPGAGPSTPAEYESAQHVVPAVVADIAAWLTPNRGKIARFVSSFRRHSR